MNEIQITGPILSKHFVSFPLNFLACDTVLPAPVFVFINGKFLEFKSKGSIIPPEKFDTLILKKIVVLFVLLEDLNIFLEWHKNRLNEELKLYSVLSSKDNRDVIQIQESIKEQIFKIFTADVIDEKIVHHITYETRNFVKIVSEKTVADVAFAKLSSSMKNIVDHSLNVAMLSIYLAHHLGLKQQLILETLFLGALFHDIGKSMLKESDYDEPNHEKLNFKLKEHTKLGKEALQSIPNLNDEILRIIEEHHEHNDGSGYPAQKKGGSIYDLSKIVSIANAFDNLVSKGQGSLRERTLNAIAELEKDQGHLFDPHKLSKSIKALRLIIK